jgi:hypothetical protein
LWMNTEAQASALAKEEKASDAHCLSVRIGYKRRACAKRMLR